MSKTKKNPFDNQDYRDGFRAVLTSLDMNISITEQMIRSGDFPELKHRHRGQIDAYTVARDAVMRVVRREQERAGCPQNAPESTERHETGDSGTRRHHTDIVTVQSELEREGLA